MAERRTLTRSDLPEKRIAPWIANEIWHVLVEECGAQRTLHPKRDDHHLSFIAYLDSENGFGHEYRFMGALGFGGKFYNDGRRWLVGCYSEDATPASAEMIRRANDRLDELRARVNGEAPDG